MSLFVFCFVQYLTILFGCTGVRWLDATCTDSSRQLHGFRQRDLATSRVSKWRSSRATPCARYLAPRTSHPPCVTFSPRRKIGVGGGFLFDFSGSILRVLRDSAPPLPKMLWPWRRGSGFVTATCHMHAACVYSPSTLGRSPTPLGRPGSFVSRGGVHRRWAYTLGAEAQVTHEM